jgi:hypothetical protein
VEERAGVVHPPGLADRGERELPRMDPPNVLWFFGAIVTAFAVNLLLASFPNSHNGLWIFLGSLGFFVAFAGAARFLFGLWWWVPAGLAAALAVSLIPGVLIGFLKLIDVWPDDPFFEPFSDFSGWAFVVALLTAAGGVVAFVLTRFSFILAEVVAAILVASQLLVPAFASQPGGDDYATMAIVVGAGLVIVGVFLDAFGRRRDAFWFHALGFFAVAVALVYWGSASSGDHERGWIPMLIAGLVVLLVAGPTRRATWALYGVLGYFTPLVRYMVNGLNENSWPFALYLLFLALSIFVLGIALHRYGRLWADRFVRRPPPAVEPPSPAP